MTDLTSNTPESVRSHKPPKTEFMVYFAVIFVATLPLAVLTWALKAVRTMALPDRGPVARAWTQARIITPMIFSA
ncbi:cytochrome PufQ [Primorskyibacter sp. S187A]|uniref:cytochrome PufQ n=1 Tax=Primorskyibacter sp. S187A TaxID=3415130 RepID=UPI003C7B7508